MFKRVQAIVSVLIHEAKYFHLILTYRRSGEATKISETNHETILYQSNPIQLLY